MFHVWKQIIFIFCYLRKNEKSHFMHDFELPWKQNVTFLHRYLCKIIKYKHILFQKHIVKIQKYGAIILNVHINNLRIEVN